MVQDQGNQLLYQQWMEKIFPEEGDNPEHTYILVCAPTGTAAADIHGQTLHHSFSFNFNWQ